MQLETIKTQLNNRRIAQAVCVILGILWSVTLLQQFSKQATDLQINNPQPSQNIEIKPLPAINQFHMFGENIAVAELSDAPETDLALLLSGVLASGGEGKGSAIIAEQGGKEHIYNVGDILPGNAKLIHVYPDKVVLSRQGSLETLMLPQHLRDHQRY